MCVWLPSNCVHSFFSGGGKDIQQLSPCRMTGSWAQVSLLQNAEAAFFPQKNQVNLFYCHLDISYLLLVQIDQPVPLSIQSSTLLFSKLLFFAPVTSPMICVPLRETWLLLLRVHSSANLLLRLSLQSLSVLSACLAEGIWGKINPLPILGILFWQVSWPAHLCGWPLSSGERAQLSWGWFKMRT